MLKPFKNTFFSVAAETVFSKHSRLISYINHKSAEPHFGFVMKHEERMAGFQIVKNTSYVL